MEGFSFFRRLRTKYESVRKVTNTKNYECYNEVFRIIRNLKQIDMKAEVKKQDLLFPELSYQIVGCAFEVFKEIGPGHLEKIYQKALAKAFQRKNINTMNKFVME